MAPGSDIYGYATGNVDGKGNVGGLVGNANNSKHIRVCDW